jgi:hypothetical protein
VAVKKSFRDTLRANDKAHHDLAAMTGRPVNEKWLNHKLPAKKRGAVVRDGRSEGEIQGDIISLLKRHPKIVFFERVNSGAMQVGNRFVRFNKVYSGGQDFRTVDLQCTLKDGRRFVIECKEADWKAPDWDALMKKERMLSDKESRELGQKNYIDAVIEAGGIGIFATSVDDVLNALEDA